MRSAAVVVASGIGVVALGGDDDKGSGKDRPSQVADIAGGLTGPVFSVGTTVYLDGGSRTATIDDKAIKSMYYTSAGVVVRHGNNNYSDGGGPMRFSLVAPDGTVRPLDVTFEETVPSTDPDEPYLAYADEVDDVVQVVVLDVRDGSEAARVPVPDAKTWGGWEAPPVSLDGDLVYVGTDDVQRVVDWRTGEVSTTDAVGPGYPTVRDGHAVTYDGRSSSVVDVSDGSVIVTADKNEFLMMSPDGQVRPGPDLRLQGSRGAAHRPEHRHRRAAGHQGQRTRLVTRRRGVRAQRFRAHHLPGRHRRLHDHEPCS